MKKIHQTTVVIDHTRDDVRRVRTTSSGPMPPSLRAMVESLDSQYDREMAQYEAEMIRQRKRTNAWLWVAKIVGVAVFWLVFWAIISGAHIHP